MCRLIAANISRSTEVFVESGDNNLAVTRLQNLDVNFRQNGTSLGKICWTRPAITLEAVCALLTVDCNLSGI